MMSPRRLAVELTGRLDGPHADEHTAGAADLAAECVRFLNYATGSHAGPDGGVTWPSTVYSVTGGLSQMAERMPQLFTQMSLWLAAETADGRVGMDDRSDPAPAIAEARAHLNAAKYAALQLMTELSAAQNALAAVNGRGPARDGGAL
jgi:hypothetical protein